MLFPLPMPPAAEVRQLTVLVTNRRPIGQHSHRGCQKAGEVTEAVGAVAAEESLPPATFA